MTLLPALPPRPDPHASRDAGPPVPPVAVVGAGPVGLAAAAHLLELGLPVRVYEAGEGVAANVRDWGYVRLFSPWGFNVDPAARALLLRQGWREPPADDYPTGHELVARYLEPLATTPELAPVIELGAAVLAIGRSGLDKVVSRGREGRPFVLAVRSRDGRTRRDLARAVLDASGTWASPNPLGAGGLPADGEAEARDAIAYGVPDVLGRDRAAYAGRATLVLGAGHSAANVLLDLAALAEEAPGTALTWAVRGAEPGRVLGTGTPGAPDVLAARAELGERLRGLLGTGRLRLVTGFATTAVERRDGGLLVRGDTADGPAAIGPVHRIVAATGQRPDPGLTRELRLDLDPALESARALGPLIDPNVHTCGSVPPHGARELSHPEPGFFTVGIKSYGRAPTFLMRTGYGQVRSVVAALRDGLASERAQATPPGACEAGATTCTVAVAAR